MDLVRDTIERDYPDWQKQSDEQSKLAPDAMGWTIDLSHHDIRILPEEVVHILEDNVRRSVFHCTHTAAFSGCSYSM